MTDYNRFLRSVTLCPRPSPLHHFASSWRIALHRPPDFSGMTTAWNLPRSHFPARRTQTPAKTAVVTLFGFQRAFSRPPQPSSLLFTLHSSLISPYSLTTTDLTICLRNSAGFSAARRNSRGDIDFRRENSPPHAGFHTLPSASSDQ